MRNILLFLVFISLKENWKESEFGKKYEELTKYSNEDNILPDWSLGVYIWEFR